MPDDRTLDEPWDDELEEQLPGPPANHPELNLVRIEDLLCQNTINFINSAPENPMIRGLILNETELWIPEELKTPDAIFAWVLENAPKKPACESQSVTAAIEIQQAGNCNFTRTIRYVRSFTLTPETVQRLASQSNNRDDFYSRLSAWLQHEGGEVDLDPDEGAVHGVETTDHEIEDSEPITRWETSLDVLRGQAFGMLSVIDRETYHRLKT